MNKTLLVIGREYLTRVRKRTFIISTILFPLLYMGLIFGTSYIAARSGPDLHVAVIDSSGYFDKGKIERQNQLDKDSSSVLTLVTDMSVDSLRKNFQSLGYDGFIYVPANIDWEKGTSLPLETSSTMGLDATAPVQSKLNKI